MVQLDPRVLRMYGAFQLADSLIHGFKSLTSLPFETMRESANLYVKRAGFHHRLGIRPNE